MAPRLFEEEYPCYAIGQPKNAWQHAVASPQPKRMSALQLGDRMLAVASQLDVSVASSDFGPTLDAGGGGQSVPYPRYKTELCRHHQQQGWCLFGNRCLYAHGSDELHVSQQQQSQSQPLPLPKSKTVAIEEPVNSLDPLPTPKFDNKRFANNRQNIDWYRYKTEICHHFAEFNWCQYADKCLFAHGRDELQPVTRHRKFKTQVCLEYADGLCNFGNRCAFIHEKPDSAGLLLEAQQRLQPQVKTLRWQREIEQWQREQGFVKVANERFEKITGDEFLSSYVGEVWMQQAFDN